MLIRYGSIFRGMKVYLAEQAGAAGVLLYSDPADDGFVRGPVYPDGPWRPETGVQRGSVAFLSLCPGDPFRTDVDALCGSVPRIPSIPVQPLSWGDALPFLEALGGPLAPPNFQVERL